MDVLYANGKAYPITHILADGRRVEDLSCVELPAGHPAYQIILEAADRLKGRKEIGKKV